MAKKLLAPKQEARLRRKVTRSPLAQMHVLLRRYGWKPQLQTLDSIRFDSWIWKRRGADEKILTTRATRVFPKRDRKTEWYAMPRAGLPRYDTWRGNPSVDDLEKKLKELAQQK